jgi:hypothetical protein
MAIRRTRCSERCDLGVLLREGANQARAGEVLLGLGRDVGEHGLDAFEAAVDALPEGLHQNRGQRQRADGAKGQLGAQVDHEGQREYREEQAVCAVHDCRAQELPHRIQIVGRPRHDVAGPMGVVIVGRLAFEVGEEVVAEIELNLARGPNEDLARDVEEDGGARGDQDQAQAVVDNLCLSDAVLHVVEGVTDDGWD